MWHLPFFSSGDLSAGLAIFPSVLGLFATSAVYFNVFHVQGQPVSLSGLAISSLCFVTGVVLGVLLAKRAKRAPASLRITPQELILTIPAKKIVFKVPRSQTRVYESAHFRKASIESVGIWCPTMVIQVAESVVTPAGFFSASAMTLTCPGIRSTEPAKCDFETAINPRLHVRDQDYRQMRTLLFEA